MEIDKRLEVLEGEFKLMKGELKETLSSVRDHLQRVKLPPSEVAIPVMDEDQRPAVIQGDLNLGRTLQAPQFFEASQSPPPAPQVFQVSQSPPPESGAVHLSSGGAAPSAGTGNMRPVGGSGEPSAGTGNMRPAGGSGEPSAGAPVAASETSVPQFELPDQGIKYEEFRALRDEGLSEADEGLPEVGEGLSEIGSEERFRFGGSPPAPQVNLLANLIRWVANAKKEIGSEQLPTFLEVYGIAGNLSLELKEVILHLVEITSEQSAEANAADIWSRLTLELHGILVEGGLSLQPVKPLWTEDEKEVELNESGTEEEQSKYKPLKLKVVYPQADGSEQEFTIDLNSEFGGERSSGQSPASGEARG